jgi:hypothetical protein
MAGIKNDPRPKGTKESWGTSISRPHGYSENSEPNGYWYATEKLVVCGKQINDYPTQRGRV